MIIRSLKTLFSPSRIEVAGDLTKKDRKMFQFMLPDVELLAQKHDVFVKFNAQRGKDTKLGMEVFKKGVSHVYDIPTGAECEIYPDRLSVPWKISLYKSDDCGGFREISSTIKRILGYED